MVLALETGKTGERKGERERQGGLRMFLNEAEIDTKACTQENGAQDARPDDQAFFTWCERHSYMPTALIS